MDRRREQEDDLDLNVTAETAGADREAAREEAKKDPDPNMSTTAGEVVGGTGGALAGAAVGTVIAGPIGTAVGAIAGALGGWWAGHEVSEASARWTDDQDRYYRDQFEGRDDRPADRAYEDVRPAYQLGHLAAHNPDYEGRPFHDVEPELRSGWSKDLSNRGGDWVIVRVCAAEAYDRARAERSGTKRRSRDADLGETSEGEEARRRY
jgi:hypothetical protein